MKTVYAKTRLKLDLDGDLNRYVPRHHALTVVEQVDDLYFVQYHAGGLVRSVTVQTDEVLEKSPRPSQLKTDMELLMHRVALKYGKLPDGPERDGLVALWDAMYEAVDLL